MKTSQYILFTDDETPLTGEYLNKLKNTIDYFKNQSTKLIRDMETQQKKLTELRQKEEFGKMIEIALNYVMQNKLKRNCFFDYLLYISAVIECVTLLWLLIIIFSSFPGCHKIPCHVKTIFGLFVYFLLVIEMVLLREIDFIMSLEKCWITQFISQWNKICGNEFEVDKPVHEMVTKLSVAGRVKLKVPKCACTCVRRQREFEQNSDRYTLLQYKEHKDYGAIKLMIQMMSMIKRMRSGVSILCLLVFIFVCILISFGNDMAFNYESATRKRDEHVWYGLLAICFMCSVWLCLIRFVKRRYYKYYGLTRYVILWYLFLLILTLTFVLFWLFTPYGDVDNDKMLVKGEIFGWSTIGIDVSTFIFHFACLIFNYVKNSWC